MTKKKRFFLKTAGVLLLAIVILVFFALTLLAKMARDLPSPEQFAARQISQSTKIYDRSGEMVLYEIHGEEKRTIIPFEQIPEFAKKATIAIEDQKFYEHQSFDWRSVIRALIVNALKGKIVQGGSTITQQLAKNAFLTPERTLNRKVRELILSRWIEQRYSKDEILNLYLNQIPYGANAYGIEEASQTYFGKPAQDLTLTESALLAALPKAPSYYSPWSSHLNELLDRKNYILEQMRQMGFIDEEQKTSAQKTELKFTDQRIGQIKAPHFVMIVKEYLSEKYGEDMLEKGGLKVITTLDLRLQGFAEKAAGGGAERNAELYDGRNAALAAEDPKTGQILAMVGSKDYFGKSEPEGCEVKLLGCQFQGNFNVATQGLRQPGSAFKPFAYITALEKGYTPETIVFDLPTEFSTISNACPLLNINYSDDNPLCFHPENFDRNFRGPVNLKDALAQSINVPSVKVLYLAGLENAIKTAADFGLTTLTDPNRYGLSLVLGGGEVKLAEMVHGYSVFAQDGIKHKRSFILKIENPSGEILEEYKDDAAQIIDPQYARQINEILSDPNARSPLFQNSFNLTIFPDREVALKTGTTNNYKDAWAIGYTPSLVAGVWAGNNNNKPMQRQAGSILAAVPIWHDFMREALNDFPIEGFPAPNPAQNQEEKPMLNGQYAAGAEIHDILYYVDKNDPLGPPPQNPANDPQFLNWEAPVGIWTSAAENRPPAP